MSGRSCISKTNEMFFGAIWQFMYNLVTDRKVLFTTLLIIGLLIVVAGEVILGIWFLDSMVQTFPQMLLFGVLVIAVTVTATVIYTVILIDNCAN